MEEYKSKSQKKRDAEALQKIGLKMLALSVEKLDRIPLPDNLRQAIMEAKKIKSHGAARRQAQLIGKLMRNADYEAIILAYENLAAEASTKTALFHEAELWRDRLIKASPHALTEFVEKYHPEDLQQLKVLIKKAIEEQQHNLQNGSGKNLFRFLRICLS